MQNDNEHFDEENFRPKGAIAFFIALITLFTILWFVIYFIAISRIQ